MASIDVLCSILLATALLGCRTSTCPLGAIEDCNGKCMARVERGDGTCDDGTEPFSADFACDDLAWDDGDCTPPQSEPGVDGCADGQMRDCNHQCIPAARLGKS